MHRKSVNVAGEGRALYFSGDNSERCWTVSGRLEALYLAYRIVYRLLLETALYYIEKGRREGGSGTQDGGRETPDSSVCATAEPL
jgi:hypothetical protein